MTATSDSRSLGVYELKVHLSSVLEEVLAGASVTVTRHGHPIARISPVSATTPQERSAAVARIKAARKGRTLAGSTKALIDEGRP